MTTPFDRTYGFTDAECRDMLEDIWGGKEVVLPVNEQHARSMLLVAQYYIDMNVQQTFKILKAEYK